MSGEMSKVLLVDDEENIVRAITRLLLDEESSLEVLSANSGPEGLKVLEAHPDVALILSDQRMPGMSGAEFLQKAREIAPEAVRMVLTGYADVTATIDAINKGGASRYLTKPWDDGLLLTSIREGVRQFRLIQENRELNALVEKQNRELAEWNAGLKGRVLEQTATIRRQNEELRERNRQVSESFRQTIVAFSRLVELHSSTLQEHTRNVTELCERTAAALGLDAEETETLRSAALLHDIGVIGIAPKIVQKRLSNMTGEEQEIFLQHAVRGQTAIDAVAELRKAGGFIRHHHERYDGAGVPDRLAGGDIPLGARIIAFADFIDRELDGQRGEAPVARVLAKAADALGRELDPELYPVMEPHVRALYLATAAAASSPAEEMEVRPRQLIEGMVLTRTVYSGSGLLLVSEGTVLDAGSIAVIQRHYKVDPPAGGIHVGLRLASDGREEKGVGTGERELPPERLREGMRISRSLYSGTGLLLLTAGTVLDSGSIEAVKRYFRIDPPSGGVYITPPQE
ncbi:two-component system response regulator [Geomonas sp. Red276]